MTFFFADFILNQRLCYVWWSDFMNLLEVEVIINQNFLITFLEIK